MSDMSRPPELPSAADHERHDALLVAQLAAGDPLDQAEQRRAAALVAGCSECASLAADLRSVAAAVAWEPVPPRRRDFRLSAAQAERAQGSALQRFMRRLALPQANGLRPLAAGVMSLGLVLVLAGNFWPEDLVDDTISQDGAVPAARSAPSLSPAESGSQQNVMPGAEAAAATPEALVENVAKSRAAAPTSGLDASLDDGFEGRLDVGIEAEESMDELAQIAASGDLATQEASGQRAEAPDISTDPSAFEAVTEAADAMPDASAAPPALAPGALYYEQDESPRDSDALEAAVVIPEASLQPPDNARAVGGASGLEEPEKTNTAEAAGATFADGPVLGEAAADGTSIQSVTVVLGLALLVVGLLLWLAVWLARRRAAKPLTW